MTINSVLANYFTAQYAWTYAREGSFIHTDPTQKHIHDFNFGLPKIRNSAKFCKRFVSLPPHKASSLRAPTLARKNWDWVLYQGCKHVAATDPTAARRRNRTMVVARKVFAFRKDFAKIPPQPWHENPGKRARMPNRLIWLSLEFENI